ncbi:MAG: hypothetical protein LUG95_03975 [Clostridiales bacterium]|nr:hypothetical protein [Clostridiales bacterium]
MDKNNGRNRKALKDLSEVVKADETISKIHISIIITKPKPDKAKDENK